MRICVQKAKKEKGCRAEVDNEISQRTTPKKKEISRRFVRLKERKKKRERERERRRSFGRGATRKKSPRRAKRGASEESDRGGNQRAKFAGGNLFLQLPANSKERIKVTDQQRRTCSVMQERAAGGGGGIILYMNYQERRRSSAKKERWGGRKSEKKLLDKIGCLKHRPHPHDRLGSNHGPP